MPRHTREQSRTNRRRDQSKAIRFLQKDAILSTPYQTQGDCEEFQLMSFPTEQDARLCVEQRGLLDPTRFKIRIWPCVYCKGWHETDKEIQYGYDGAPQMFEFYDVYELYPDVYALGYNLMSFIKLFRNKFPEKLEEGTSQALDLLYRKRIPDEYWTNWWLWSVIRKAYKGTQSEGLDVLIPALREAYDASPDRDELRDPQKLFHCFKQSRVEYPLTVDSPCYKWIIDGYNLYGKRIISMYHRRANAKKVAQDLDYGEIQRLASMPTVPLKSKKKAAKLILPMDLVK